MSGSLSRQRVVYGSRDGRKGDRHNQSSPFRRIPPAPNTTLRWGDTGALQTLREQGPHRRRSLRSPTKGPTRPQVARRLGFGRHLDTILGARVRPLYTDCVPEGVTPLLLLGTDRGNCKTPSEPGALVTDGDQISKGFRFRTNYTGTGRPESCCLCLPQRLSL